jgi:hypothetical protein
LIGKVFVGRFFFEQFLNFLLRDLQLLVSRFLLAGEEQGASQFSLSTYLFQVDYEYLRRRHCQ